MIAGRSSRSMPATYRWAPASLRRGCSPMRTPYRLAEDPVAELRLHGLPHDQVHAAAEDLSIRR